MMDDPDMKLLREFVTNNSEPAFTTLVARNLDLVNGVALRQVHDPHLAQEVTQAVFIILSRKAKTLGAATLLAAWLCRTTRFVALDALRLQKRRRRREQEAYMQRVAHESNPPAWASLAPHLDAGLESLSRRDHEVLILRFFKNASFAEISRTLGIGESAAKMRVARALEKLRKYFGRCGISCSVEEMAGVVSMESIPPVAKLTAGTIAAATLKTHLLGGTTLALVNSSLKGMLVAKIKTSLFVIGVVLLSVTAVSVAVTATIPHGPTAVASREDTARQLAIVARVNGRPIFKSQVDDLTASNEGVIRRAPPSIQRDQKISDLRKVALEDLIDRQLILQQAEREQFKLPGKYVEDRVQEIVDGEFAGSRSAFLAQLKGIGKTLEDFEQILRDQVIVSAMKAQALKNVFEPGQKKEALQKWLTSLRKGANIVIY